MTRRRPQLLAAAALCLWSASAALAHDVSPSTGPALLTAWTPPSERAPLKNVDIALRDHDGRARTLAALLDRPVLLTFFYTRCQNAAKCSMTVSQLAVLQRQLTRARVHDKVRLIAITFEPQFDSPERITRFATARGLQLGESALAVQLDADRHPQLVKELEIPVSYNAGWVGTHGVEASLLDAGGRVVRKYTTLLWDNDQVLRDLERVLGERPASR